MANSNEMEKTLEGIGEYKYGFSDPDTAVYRSKRGFTREVVEEISHQKNEPEWMTKIRLKAYEHAIKRPIPTWGGDLSELDLDDIYYYIKPSDKPHGNRGKTCRTTSRAPSIKPGHPRSRTQIPGGRRRAVRIRRWSITRFKRTSTKQGVIFLSSDDGLKQYPDIFKKYFAHGHPAHR